MHLELLVEEPSAEAALQVLIPRIVGDKTTFKIHPMSGKQDLLNKLAARLKGYASWLPSDWLIIVVVDCDRQDCLHLKQELETKCVKAGLLTPSTAGKRNRVHVYNRIAIEELESWFFGDPAAIAAAFPGVSPHLGKQKKYRIPESIAGGAWEALERVLQHAGHYETGLAKIDAARRIANKMEPDRNRAASFCLFRDTLRKIAASASA